MIDTIFIAFFLILSSVTSIFAQSSETIRVGVFLDMTGQTSSFGIATNNGIKMAVDEINAAGGIEGRKLDVFLEDDLGSPEKAKEAVKKLIAERNIHVLLGEVASTNSLFAGPVAQEAKIPMITPSSTNPRVTQIGDYIFRVCFVDPFQGEAMAKFAFNELKLRRVAIFGDVNSDYSKGLAVNFQDTFKRLGGEILIEQAYTQMDTNFKIQLKSIRKTKPDAIYLPGYYNQVGIIAKQTRELGMNMPLLGGDGWDSPELWKLSGYALKNSYITNHFALDNPEVVVREFVRKYDAKYDSEADALAALGYDTVYLLADALRRAKSADGEGLRDALAATKDFSGVTGKIRNFDGSRNAIKPVVILKLDEKNVKFLYHSSIQP